MAMLGACAWPRRRLASSSGCSTTARSTARTNATTYLRDQITQVDARSRRSKQLDQKKQKLLARKEVIEKLQANRSQMVHLFDSLVRTIPDGVTLTSIQQDGDELTLQGPLAVQRARQLPTCATWKLRLDDQPGLSVIEARGTTRAALRVRPDGQAANPECAASTPTATACRMPGRDRAPPRRARRAAPARHGARRRTHGAAGRRPPHPRRPHASTRHRSRAVSQKKMALKDLSLNNTGVWPQQYKIALCVVIARRSSAWSGTSSSTDQRAQLESWRTRTLRRSSRPSRAAPQPRAAQAAARADGAAAPADAAPAAEQDRDAGPDHRHLADRAGHRHHQRAVPAGPGTPKEFYAEKPIQLRMVGTYHQFGAFVSGVASLPRVVIMTMHNIVLTPRNRRRAPRSVRTASCSSPAR
jgi:Tfp pilus assembly protein PilO